ncbi:MAG: hypothetical protein KQA41_00270 [Candidatus Aenigmarchaeota archaeon]|nr:hypothetical protein [Candidatus Aenigmarchaeota archaeon]
MKKGLSGFILAILITLIVALIASVIFWIFLRNTTEGAKTFSEQIYTQICESLGILKGLMGC